MIPLDKRLHFLAGAIAAVCLWHWGPGTMLASAAWLGILKEIYDWYHPETHTCDIRDALATALGGIVPAVIWLLHWLIRG